MSAPKKLVDLDPRWLSHGGDGVLDKDGNAVPERRGIGVSFECPCGCDQRCAVLFETALDGQPVPPQYSPTRWQRTGDTFETLTLSPSLHRVVGCVTRWHGWIRSGEAITC